MFSLRSVHTPPVYLSSLASLSRRLQLCRMRILCVCIYIHFPHIYTYLYLDCLCQWVVYAVRNSCEASKERRLVSGRIFPLRSCLERRHGYGLMTSSQVFVFFFLFFCLKVVGKRKNIPGFARGRGGWRGGRMAAAGMMMMMSRGGR